ncbi:MAG: RagB/SusD family nutrient uptake outer membrane protein [Bacteroidota bacterium]|nr:RagB/SusD family nutrient uptake outer membrane protein [Bacteroidota bacterium]
MNTKYLFKPLTAAFAICMLLVLGSCKKYLNQQPITEVTTPVVFKDVSTAYLALIGVYSRLAGQDGYGQRLSLYYTVDTDEMQGPTGTDDERRNLSRYQPTPANGALLAPFNQIFQGIEFANNVIDNVPKMDIYTSGSDQDKKKLQRIYGEALTLRAQFYFEAIRNWGDLPAHFNIASSQIGTDPFPVRIDRDTLYSHILDDLKIAEDIVPWRSDVASIGDPVDERITKGIVKGLRARIALFRGGYSLRQDSKVMERRSDYLKYYQIARDETNDIISSGQHSLNPSYKDLWKNQVGKHVVSDPNNELMFQVGSIGGVSAEDSRLGYYDGPRMNNGTIGNAAINVLPSYFYLFDSLDTRRDVTIAPYWLAADGITKTTTNASPTNTSTSILVNLNPGKFRRDWNTTVASNYTGQFLGTKWQILRYADVLLMYAEAENEINGPNSATGNVTPYTAVNMVRRRGFGKPITTANASVDLPSGLTKATFFKYLVRERSLELGGEGTRKYDLLRWNLLATALGDAKINLATLGTATATLTTNDIMYSYQAPGPSYTGAGYTLPLFVFFRTGTTSDDISTIFVNSLYKVTPATTPSGVLRVPWISTTIKTTMLDNRFAVGFTPGRSELLPIPNAARNANPNLTQNPNYQ